MKLIRQCCRFVILMTLLAAGQEPAMVVVAADDVSVSITMGGVQRGAGGHWSLIRGTFSNSGDESGETLVVVTPEGSHGLQYARRATVPPGVIRECQWPVFMPLSNSRGMKLDYIVLPGSEAQGGVQRKQAEEVVRSISTVNPTYGDASATGYCGWLNSYTQTPRESEINETLLATMRKSVGQLAMVAGVTPQALGGYPEALGPLSQLAISSPDLHQFPDACDAVRTWIQRGGKALIFVEQTGPDVVSAVLGDALPLTIIDETSMNIVEATINPATSETRMPQRTYRREFPEPVYLTRAIVEGGFVHWSLDEWPVVVELPLGQGRVLLSFLSPEVYYSSDVVVDKATGKDSSDGHMEVTPIGAPILAALFNSLPPEPLVSSQALATAAADRIGYSVPSTGLAASIMFGFTLALLSVGLVAHRRERPGLLLWLVPALAGVATVPAILAGTASRGVAPQTAIRQNVIHVAPGQTTLAMDGVTSVYCPEPATLNVEMTDFALTHPISESTDADIRRLVSTARGVAHWQNLTQSTGVRNYQDRSLLRLSKPLRAVATFDAQGLTGRLTNATSFNPEDAILAGLSPDRMAVIIGGDGTFQCTPADMLAPQQFSTSTLLSETQVSRALVFSEAFDRESRKQVFPAEPTLFYWSDSVASAILAPGQGTHAQTTALIAQPLKLSPPAANTTITIPATLLPYRAIANTSGSISSAFSNRLRIWIDLERPASTLLAFSIPEACRPFRALTASIDLRIRAGSREVKLLGGSPDDMRPVQTLNSPVGLFTITYPGELLRRSEDDAMIFLQLDVGSANIDDENGLTTAAQDDAWRVERVMMTLTGQRVE